MESGGHGELSSNRAMPASCRADWARTISVEGSALEYAPLLRWLIPAVAVFSSALAANAAPDSVVTLNEIFYHPPAPAAARHDCCSGVD